jgi:hypothetical protein
VELASASDYPTKQSIPLLDAGFVCYGSQHVMTPDFVPVTEARVEVRSGSPVLTINGEPTFFACHYIRHYQGNRWADGVRDSVKQFAARGIHSFEAQVDLGWDETKRCDPEVDPMMAAILDADPLAQVVLRIGAHNLLPDNLPAAFRERFADELEADHAGKRYSVSFASDVGFDEIASALQRLVRRVEAQSYSGHIVGYNIFLEFEGVPWGSVAEGAFTDYSPAMQRAWRVRCTDFSRNSPEPPEGGTPNNRLPTPAEHLGGDPRFIFHHPVKARRVRQYYELMDELTIRRHRQIARAVKEACGSRKLVGMMGGYSQDAGEPRSIMSPTGFPEVQLHKQHFSGPGCWGRCFEIPEIDFYFAPKDYLNTGMGGVFIPLHMPASLRLQGKLAWIEDDQRTHRHKDAAFNPHVLDVRETVMLHRRNAAALYTEFGCADWMEQAANWLLDPPVLDNLGRINRLLQESIAAPGGVPDAICVLFDEESQGWTKPTTLLDELQFYHARNGGLSYCGVPVRWHLLSDLALPVFPRYKFYILPNAYHWTDEKEKLLAKVKREGNVLLWMYGAGYVGERGFSLEAMERTTGFRIAAEPHPWEHRIGITDFTHPITRDLPGNLTFGTTRHYGPIFHIEDPDARVLGRSFGFGMSRHAGLAIKPFQGCTSIYCEAPNLPAELLRGIARFAGCHVYLDTNDFLLAGKDIVMVHSAKPGPRTLRLPRRCDVFDWFAVKPVAGNAREVNFDLASPGTVVFRVKETK